MAGITEVYRFGPEGGTDPLQELMRRMDDREGFFRAVGDFLMATTQDNFRTQTDPEGIPWQKLAPRTIRQRTRKGQLPLTILRSNANGGAGLAASIRYQASQEAVEIGSPKPYAAIHQLGGRIERQARKAKIYRKKDKGGKVRPGFVKKGEADTVTDVEIGDHTINIPRRTYIGISSGDQEVIIAMADTWLRGG